MRTTQIPARKIARKIVLASASPYRQELLARLRLPFVCYNADVDETPHPNETAAEIAARLAAAKARAGAEKYTDALIIGADQVGELGGEPGGDIIGKPGDHATALAQLLRMSGGAMTLHSGLALYDPAAELQCAVEAYAIQFRKFNRATADAYLRQEQPYNCCGSLKAEGLGIALIAKMQGDDPTAIIGLPLIRLVKMLTAAGIAVV